MPIQAYRLQENASCPNYTPDRSFGCPSQFTPVATLSPTNGHPLLSSSKAAEGRYEHEPEDCPSRKATAADVDATFDSHWAHQHTSHSRSTLQRGRGSKAVPPHPPRVGSARLRLVATLIT